MAYQTGKNVIVAYKAEGSFGVAAGASGGTVFRPTGGSGNLTKKLVESGEVRRDGQVTRGRHGSKNVNLQYSGELSLDTWDDLFEALFRGTWAAELVITQATGSPALTSITTGANTIVAASGSFISAGLRVGDVIILTGHSSAGNNSRNLRITGLTATTITVQETLTVNAVADTSFTITRKRKLVNPVAGSLVRKSFTFEEYEQDIDASEQYLGCRVSSLALKMAPNGMIDCDFGLVGQDMATLTAGSAPYFTSPAATVTAPMVVVDAKLLLGGVEVADLTGLDLAITLNAQGVDVISGYLTPDVFEGSFRVTGQIAALRQDLSKVTDFVAETQFSIHLLAVDNESEPKDFVSFFIGNVTFAGASKNALGADGPRIQTLPMQIGIDERGGEYDVCTVKIETSAA